MRIEVEWFAYLAVEKGAVSEAQCNQLRAALGDDVFLVPFGKALVDKGFVKDLATVKTLAAAAWAKVDTGARPPRSVFGTVVPEAAPERHIPDVPKDVQWFACLVVQDKLASAETCRVVWVQLPQGADSYAMGQALLDQGHVRDFDKLQSALDQVAAKPQGANPPLDVFSPLLKMPDGSFAPAAWGASRAPFKPGQTPGVPAGGVGKGGGGPGAPKDPPAPGAGGPPALGGLAGTKGLLPNLPPAGKGYSRPAIPMSSFTKDPAGGDSAPAPAGGAGAAGTRPAGAPGAPGTGAGAGTGTGGLPAPEPPKPSGEEADLAKLAELARANLEAKKAGETKAPPKRELTESERALERMAAAAEAAEQAAQKAEQAAASVGPVDPAKIKKAPVAAGKAAREGEAASAAGGGTSSAGLAAKMADFAALAALPDPQLKQALIQMLMAINERGASDLHLSAQHRPYLRRNRVIEYLSDKPLDEDLAKRLNTLLLTPPQAKQFKEVQDLDFALSLDEKNRFRVNLMVHRDGTKGTYRAITNRVMTFEELGFKNVEPIKKMLSYHNGLIMVAGPVGSGKTTTLTTMVDYLNREREDHIITVEDPIEFVHKAQGCNVTQRQAGLHTNSFRAALKGALREDPDIIVIGEMRDLETIEMGISASETGHLVIGTMHTNDATTTLNRLLDVFPPAQQGQIRAMVSESLRGVICQRLLPTKDGKLALALEILVNNLAVANMIREAKMTGLANALETGKRLGMLQMDGSVFELWQQGKITNEVALANITNKMMRQQIEGKR